MLTSLGWIFFMGLVLGLAAKKVGVATSGWYDGSWCGDGSLSTGDFG